MTKKAISLFLSLGLALVAVPVGAKAISRNSVWGSVPEGDEGTANAVLLDASGRVVATVPVIGGVFLFYDLLPGDYVVSLCDASGRQIARSLPVGLVAGAERVGTFVGTAPPVAAAAAGATGPSATGGAAGTAGGTSTTANILVGARRIGIVGFIRKAPGGGGVASPIR